jgi:hypothetical protein
MCALPRHSSVLASLREVTVAEFQGFDEKLEIPGVALTVLLERGARRVGIRLLRCEEVAR